MSKELDDITHALAELVAKLHQESAEKEAIIQVVDCLVMTFGSIERRLDALERNLSAHGGNDADRRRLN